MIGHFCNIFNQACEALLTSLKTLSILPHLIDAGVAELVDASVSKTDEGKPRAGSIPALGTLNPAFIFSFSHHSNKITKRPGGAAG